MRTSVLILFAVIGLAGLAVPFLKLTASSFWVDELNTVYQLHLDSSIWRAFVERQSIDFHPPLYPLLLRLWLIPLEVSDATIRAFSTVLAIGFGALIFFWARARLSLEAALFALAFTVTAAGFVTYSIEARNYMLAYLLATGLFLLLLKAREAKHRRESLSGGYWWSVFLIGLALSWTHYFGFLFTGAIYAYLLLLYAKARSRWIILALGAASFTLIAGYIAWSSGRMIVEPTANPIANSWQGFIAVIWLYVYGGLGGNIALPLFSLILVLWLALLRLKRGDREAIREDLSIVAPVLFISLFVYLAGTVISLIYTPLLFANRIGIAWPACWITLAILFWRLISALQPQGKAILRTLAALAILGGLPLWLATAEPVKEEWRASAQYVGSLESCEGAVIAFPVRHAFHQDLETHTIFRTILTHYLPGEAFADFTAFQIDNLTQGEMPPEFSALAGAPERACPVLLWSVHLMSYDQLVTIKERLEGAVLGLELQIKEFPHHDLWLWSGEWLWSPGPPKHSKAFLLLKSS